MTRQKILDSFVVDDRGIIRSPGKFEAEKLYVPHFWFLFLDGDDGDDDRTDGRIHFTITDEDREEFPELPRRKALTLIENADGFVCEVP